MLVRHVSMPCDVDSLPVTMMKKCMNCRAPLVDKAGKQIGGVQCAKCKKNQEKYGKPGICEHCKLTAAFVDAKCVHCCHGNRKFGPPVECSNCKLKSAFAKKGTRSDKPVLCRLCDMIENEKRQKEKENSKSSSSSSKPHKSTSKHPSAKHGQSTSKPSSVHHGKRASTGSAHSQPPAKIPKTAEGSAGNDEHTLQLHKLRDDLFDLEMKLRSKDGIILERDKKIADLNADLLRKDLSFKSKQHEMQKRFDDQTELLNERIKTLQKQLSQAQRELSKATQGQADKQPTVTKMVVIAATAPPGSKPSTDSQIALPATS
uniref:Protein FAM76B n=2 Tax=Steinernema glaseri TaxID=37863 RepID=A0A1I7ZGZ8_9BILA